MTTPAEVFNAAVGRQLRAEIAAAGSSVAAMARDIGIARSALDNYVTGKRSIPVPVLYAVGARTRVAPHVIVERAQERLDRDLPRESAPLRALPRATDVPTLRDDVPEVAFDSSLTHATDTDDLYD